MPATVLLDRVDGARLDNGVGVRQHVRAAIVYDIPVSNVGDADPNVLIKALAASKMPQIGDRHPSGDGTKCVRHLIEPLGDNQCRVLIFYGMLNDFTGAETNFYLRDSTSSQAIQTQMMPGWLNKNQKFTGNPQILLELKDKSGAALVPSKPATLTYHQPIRTIQAASKFVSRKTVNTLSEAISHVNTGKWFELPAGYWLLTSVDSESRYGMGGPYSCVATFISKNFEPWLTTITGEVNGRPIKADETELKDARGSAYFYGQKPMKNFTLVGPYPGYDFATLPLVGPLGSGP